MTQAVKVYLDLMSQPCRALNMFLDICNIPHEKVFVAIRRGEHKSEDFLKINPQGKLPAIDDNGFLLTESIAIVQYLSKKHEKLAEGLYPPSLRERARIDEYNSWQHLNTRYLSATVFIGEVIAPGAVKIEKAVNNMNKMLDTFEAVFLKNKDFITGVRVSVADLFAVAEILQPTLSGRDVFVGRENLRAYFERVKNATQPYYDETYSIFYRSKESIAKRKQKL